MRLLCGLIALSLAALQESAGSGAADAGDVSSSAGDAACDADASTSQERQRQLDPDGPRVAFCMAGCPRSLVHPVVHTSIQRNFIDAFGSANYRVFWYLKLDAGCQKESDPVDREEQLDVARKLLQPAAVKFVGARTAADDQQFGCRGLKSRNNAEQQQHIAGCAEMAFEDERAIGAKFDWIFRVRPDALWLRHFPHHSYFSSAKPKEVFIIGDVIMMVPRTLAQGILASPSLCSPGGQAHEIQIVQHLYMAGARVRWQCDHAICPWKTSKFTKFVPSSAKAWQEWRCVSPLTLVQVLYGRKVDGKPDGRSRGPGGKPAPTSSDKTTRRLFLNAGVAQMYSCHGTPEEECKAILNVTDGSLARQIVDSWGKRPMCGGPCQEQTVKSRDELIACEAKHYNFSALSLVNL